MQAIFGRSLRRLGDGHPSVAGLCHDLGTNHPQFNRHLRGESSPRPDVMHRICRFFGTDPRMVYEHLYHDPSVVMAAARTNGLITLDQVPPFQARTLRLGQPFR